MRLNGTYSIGETPSADESADGLSALNGLVESMVNEGLLIYVPTLNAITLSSGTSAYTVGPTGGTVTTRPVEVLNSSYIVYGGISYPLDILTIQDYNDIPLKTEAGSVPTHLYVLAGMPNITVTAYPTPGATMTLNLWSNKVLQSFTALTDTVTLPPGYDRMLAYNLAVEIAPEYDAVVRPDVMQTAINSRRVLKRTNTKPPLLKLPYGLPNAFSSNIYAG
tara:strand:+ start:7139 stop:7801 length:663 start_codon:yes stop_codon:yes gene_type:complete